MKTWSVSVNGKPEDVIEAVENCTDCPEAIKDCISALIPNDMERASVVTSGGIGGPENNISVSISFAKSTATPPRS
jgi:hypothetical protein